MHVLELSLEEHAVLRDVLTARLTDIRHEIHHTDNREFRTRLARHEDVLVSLLARLEQPAAAAN